MRPPGARFLLLPSPSWLTVKPEGAASLTPAVAPAISWASACDLECDQDPGHMASANCRGCAEEKRSDTGFLGSAHGLLVLSGRWRGRLRPPLRPPLETVMDTGRPVVPVVSIRAPAPTPDCRNLIPGALATSCLRQTVPGLRPHGQPSAEALPGLALQTGVARA